jgi:hypothetical protein
MRHLVRLILATYPPWWRSRYGDENHELVGELLDEPGARRWRMLGSLLFGSVLAWSQIRRRGDYLKPVASPNPWGAVPLGSHRDLFGNRGLWPRSESELQPGEVLLGVLDGVSGSPSCSRLPYIYAAIVCGSLFGNWITGNPAVNRFSLMMQAPILVAAILLRTLSRSRFVAVAVTSHGVVIFRRSLFGRTGRSICRMPAVVPMLIRDGVNEQKVALGSRVFWFRRKSQPLLSWMSGSLRRPTVVGAMSPINPFDRLP